MRFSVLALLGLRGGRLVDRLRCCRALVAKLLQLRQFVLLASRGGALDVAGQVVDVAGIEKTRRRFDLRILVVGLALVRLQASHFVFFPLWIVNASGALSFSRHDSSAIENDSDGLGDFAGRVCAAVVHIILCGLVSLVGHFRADSLGELLDVLVGDVEMG